MSNPIDYEIFVEDRIADFKRLKSVYAGEEADTPLTVATTGDTTHLSYLDSTEIPKLFAAVYGNAYDHMRATHRALAIVNYDRGDFYTHAQKDMDKQVALYKERKKVTSKLIDEIKANADQDIIAKLDQVASSAGMNKKALILNIKNSLGLGEDIDLTPEMVLEYYKRRNGEKV